MKSKFFLSGMMLLSAALLQGCGGGADAVPGVSLGSTPPTLGSSGGSTSGAAPTITYTGFAVVQDKGTYSAKVVVFFSEDMDESSINEQTILVRDAGGKLVQGSVLYIGVTGVFTPNERFEADSNYTAEITTGVRSLEGINLAKDRNWKFTTPSPSDLTGVVVAVSSNSPADYSTDVPLSTGLNVTFAQVMDPASINKSTFTLVSPAGDPIPGEVHYTGLTATFMPKVQLAPNTSYRAMISASVKSLGGISMDTDHRWTFTTGTAPGAVPQMLMNSPADGDTGVARDSSVVAYFNEAMDTQSVNTATFSVSDDNGQPIDGTVTYAGDSAVFTPDTALQPQAVYTVHVSGMLAADGTAMQDDYQWSFTTGSFSGGLAPTVVFSDPAPNASHVSRSGNISIAFSEALDPATVSTRTITVTDADGNAAAGSVNYAGNAVIFTPSSPLIPGTVYTVTVTSGIKDLQGHAFQGDYSWQFVTVNLM